MTWISTKQNQFTYFAAQIGWQNWQGLEILDFGGNVGNMLRDPASTIDPHRYWCLDVDYESLAVGREACPVAHWVHYDRQSFFFNPAGTPGLPVPDLGRTFDVIVAYSVFPNTTRADLLDLVPQLQRLLTPRGVLAFTFIDPNHVSWPGKYCGDNLRWRMEREGNDANAPETQELMEKARRARWCILVNGRELYVDTDDTADVPPEEQNTFHTFHTVDHMQSLFPHAVIRPPANQEMQHCCILGRNGWTS
jgi:SAM-dependent methyltransferase